MDYGIITGVASIITGLGVIGVATKRGRDWIFKPIRHDIQRLELRIDRNDLSTKRNELLLMINTQPQKVQAIYAAYDEYIKMGGNSYILEVFREWEEVYAKNIVKDRIS
jgi:hypothetical protein